jgi:hypothetical protein
VLISPVLWAPLVDQDQIEGASNLENRLWRSLWLMARGDRGRGLYRQRRRNPDGTILRHMAGTGAWAVLNGGETETAGDQQTQ